MTEPPPGAPAAPAAPVAPGAPGDGPATTAALLAARCLDAARAVDGPGVVDGLRAAGELLDRALEDPSLSAGRALARARDRTADLLVGLSAAGVGRGERDAMVAELREALTDLATALRSGHGPDPWQPTAAGPD